MKVLKLVAALFASIGLISVAHSHQEACQLPPKTTQFTFWETCKDVKMNGCILEAKCQRAGPGHEYRDANFDMEKFPQCYSDFFGGRNMENRDGKLCCGYAGTYQICGN